MRGAALAPAFRTSGRATLGIAISGIAISGVSTFALACGLLVLGTGGALAASVAVDVEGIEPAGFVFVALCQDGLTEADCLAGQREPPSATVQRFLFTGVTPGTYAAIAYQDTNGNGRLDRTGLGLPLEPYGFSDEMPRSARPDFARARFAVRDPGMSVRVRLSRALPRR